jgi:hypothetical protein
MAIRRAGLLWDLFDPAPLEGWVTRVYCRTDPPVLALNLASNSRSLIFVKG